MAPRPSTSAELRGLILRRGIGHTLVARVCGARIETLAAVPSHDPGGVGHIYRGRVVRIVDALNAAFVDIGAGRPAFLTADDVSLAHARPGATGPDANGPAAIRGLVFEGQALLVQIRRAPQGDKGARITTRVSLPGRLWVVSADTPSHAVSSSIEDRAERERLARQGAVLAERHQLALVARTAAQGVDAMALSDEAALLATRLSDFAAQAARERAPRWLSAERPPVAAYVVGQWRHGDAVLYADDDALADAATTALGDAAGTGSIMARPFSTWRAADSHAAFDGALQKALAATVHMPDGGTLIFGQTPALCAIDVNSGQAASHAKASRTDKRAALAAVNLEAARIAGEQIMLRNIGGIIVIDCIDVSDEAHRHAVIDALKKALHGDKERTYISRMSELGLVQLTRRQRHPPLQTQLQRACGACHTDHAVPAAWYVGTAALWATEQLLQRTKTPMVLVQCHPDVADALWGDGVAWLDAMAARHHTTLVPLARQGWPPQRFELLDVGEPGDRYPGRV